MNFYVINRVWDYRTLDAPAREWVDRADSGPYPTALAAQASAKPGSPWPHSKSTPCWQSPPDINQNHTRHDAEKEGIKMQEVIAHCEQNLTKIKDLLNSNGSENLKEFNSLSSVIGRLEQYISSMKRAADGRSSFEVELHTREAEKCRKTLISAFKYLKKDLPEDHVVFGTKEYLEAIG